MDPITIIKSEITEIAFRRGISISDWVQIGSAVVGAGMFIIALFTVRKGKQSAEIAQKTAEASIKSADAAKDSVVLQQKIAKESRFHELLKLRYSSELSLHMLAMRNFIAKPKEVYAIRKFCEERAEYPLSQEIQELENARRYVKGFYRMMIVHWKHLDKDQQEALDVPVTFFFEVFRKYEISGLTAKCIPSQEEYEAWEKNPQREECLLFEPAPECDMYAFCKEQENLQLETATK